MGDFPFPNKKPRLDETCDVLDCEFAVNDDLWGQDDLTAEEFDLLEVQASQVADQANTIVNGDPAGQISVNVNGESECDELKQKQYELEGKNKALTMLLEKSAQELSDERTSRQQIIDEKLRNYEKKESDLLQEIERLQTSLRFKDREVSAEKSKAFTLQNKFKEKAKDSVKVSPVKHSPKKLLNWGGFDNQNQSHGIESETQTDLFRSRRSVLSLQAPRGEPKENDTIHKLLGCRILDSSLKSSLECACKGNTSSMNEIFRRARDFSSMSVALLMCRKESSSIWQPYEIALQEYVSHLKIRQNSCTIAVEKTPGSSVTDGSHSVSNSPNNILPCLRDLTGLLFHLCPKEAVSCKESCSKLEKRNEMELYAAHSMPLFSGDEDKMDVTQNYCHRLLELLILLATPATYPKNCNKSCEMEWALAALLAWSSHSDESLKSYIPDLPLYSLVSGQYGVKCAYLAVKLMFQLIDSQHFQHLLVHLSDSRCILCSIGSLCSNIYDEHTEGSSGLLFDVIENFLLQVFFTHGFESIGKDSFPCSSKLLHGIIKVLLKQLQLFKECNLSHHITTIKKGVMLLSFMSAHLTDFRTRRIPAEDNYISLVCSLSKLCKESQEIKQLQGMIHDLCDFQEESSECDGE